MNPFNITKDSSIWKTDSTVLAINEKDFSIKIGIVKDVVFDKDGGDVKYLVEVISNNVLIETYAIFLRKFGGAYNFEDIVYRGYKYSDNPDPVKAYDAKAGDAVVVAFLDGESRQSIILGAIKHEARKSKIDIKKGPQYLSEFNGVETNINEKGEYKLTFKALPTNLSKLLETPKNRIQDPIYDDKIGGSYFSFDEKGSIEFNDKDKQGFQNIKINKPDGKIEINSGKIKITLSKKDEKIESKSKILEIKSEDKVSVFTKETIIDSNKSVKIKSPKIAIGKDGIELLDQLFQLIEKLGAVQPISPLGPCTPLLATPQWSQVKEVQSKIKEITGGL